MKINTKRAALLSVFLIAMLATVAVAQTNSLPEKQNVNDFIDSVKCASTNCDWTKLASEKSLDDHPSWKWDTWKDKDGKNMISFYYASGASGYGSIYLDEDGKKVSSLCGLGSQLTQSYKGTGEKEEVKETKEGTKETKEEVTKADDNDKKEEVTDTKSTSDITKIINGMSKEEKKELLIALLDSL